VSWRILLACAALVACTMTSRRELGPRSMLAESTMLPDLSPADRATLCLWWSNELGGGGRTEHCSDCHDGGCAEWDITVNTEQQCIQFLDTATCTATVKQVEDCAFDQELDLCASPPTCAVLDAC
jgi:hypothetical protein